MSIEQLGNIGEFVGAVAVLVTLVYLALQLKNNQQAVFAQTMQTRSQVIAQAQEAFLTSPELTAAWTKFHRAGSMEEGRESLDATETMLVFRYLIGLLNRLDGDVFLYEIGQLPEEIYKYNVRQSLQYHYGYWEQFGLIEGTRPGFDEALRKAHEELGPYDYDPIFKSYSRTGGDSQHEV